MIFPILSGLTGWRKAPVTWLVVLVNLVMTAYASLVVPDGLEEIMHKRFFLRTQGQMYARYLRERAASRPYPELLVEMARQVDNGAMDPRELGELAFRDADFLEAAGSMESDGDQVALSLWRKRLADMEDIEERHPSFNLGLSARDMGYNKWVSYIFVHSGWVHFVGNMLIFMIYGAALEALVGGLGVLVVFLLSGLIAAGCFAVLTGVANSPLVGASGAISGVVALFSVLSWKRPVRYFYWFFLPFRGYMGLVYLPAWVGLALWALSDLAGYFGTPAELGGVAYTAHLGGEAAGCLAGLTIFALRRFWPVPVPDLKPPPIKMGVLIPFLPPRRSPFRQGPAAAKSAHP